MKPSFFIIGAPKCGTTSLYRYLTLHPNIIMSKPKEPHYFSDDINNGRISELGKYLNCFNHVDEKEEIKAIGEASTLYLYSKIAIKNILSFNKNARFIVMLRNPIDIVYTYHQVAMKVFGETQSNFINAWNLQGKRIKGYKVPAACPDKKLLAYGEIAKLGKQVKRLLSFVDREKIFFLLFDDFINSTEKEHLSILRFLNVDPIALKTYKKYNKTKLLRNSSLTAMTNRLVGIKNKIGFSNSLGIAGKIHKLNTTEGSFPAIDKELMSDIGQFFAHDLDLLSSLIKRNLSDWRYNK